MFFSTKRKNTPFIVRTIIFQHGDTENNYAAFRAKMTLRLQIGEGGEYISVFSTF
jgi:hypothetical protein